MCCQECMDDDDDDVVVLPVVISELIGYISGPAKLRAYQEALKQPPVSVLLEMP